MVGHQFWGLKITSFRGFLQGGGVRRAPPNVDPVLLESRNRTDGR